MQGITYLYKGVPAYPYYKCNGRSIKSLGLDCDMPSVKIKPIEALVWDKISEIVTNPELIQVSLGNFEPEVTEKDLARARQTLEEKHGEQERLITAYRKGIIEMEDLEQQIELIKREVKMIDERCKELEEMLLTTSYEEKVIEMLHDQIEAIQGRIEKCSFEDKREIIQLIVRKIWLGKQGEVEIEAKVLIGDHPGFFPNLSRPYSDVATS